MKTSHCRKERNGPDHKVCPKEETEKTSSGVAAAEDSAGPVLGYAAALHERAVAMQSKGLKTTLPTLFQRGEEGREGKEKICWQVQVT